MGKKRSSDHRGRCLLVGRRMRGRRIRRIMVRRGRRGRRGGRIRGVIGGEGGMGDRLGKGWAGGERRWIELLSELFWCDIPLHTGTHGVWVGMNGLCSVLEGGVKGYHVLRLIPCLFDYVCYGDTIDAGLGEGVR